jgi:hypothetical protein
MTALCFGASVIVGFGGGKEAVVFVAGEGGGSGGFLSIAGGGSLSPNDAGKIGEVDDWGGGVLGLSIAGSGGGSEGKGISSLAFGSGLFMLLFCAGSLVVSDFEAGSVFF